MTCGTDRSLGMHRPITRRDFLDGVRIGLAGSLLSSHPWLEALAQPGQGLSPQNGPGYYPPALTGLRGSHDGSWEVAHALRDGKTWDETGSGGDTGESYELVVVGGGISGLSAAYFFRKAAGPRARILVLDNHDDFGGHAKRNEFRHGSRLMLGYGGTQSIDGPTTRYSAVARGLIEELGIDINRFYAAFDQKLYSSLNLGRGIFFDKETFGVDRLVAGEGELPWPDFLSKTPLSEEARKDIARVYLDEKDALPGLTPEEKRARLRRMSYRDYLKDVVGLHADALPFFQARTHGFFASGIDAIPAESCWRFGYPGFQGLGLDRTGQGRQEPYIHHFPDGNASVVRLLVRSLIPEAVPGNSMEDVVTSRLDYGLLDKAGSPARIRLNSTVVRVRHLSQKGEPDRAREVEVTYVSGGKAHRVRAEYCVLACYNGMIPYLCPEMPEEQRRALSYGVKRPLVYTNVLIRDWKSFHNLGVSNIHSPGSFHTTVSLDFPVSLGEYRHPRTPEEPMVLHLVRVPTSPGLPAREQARAGRYELLATSFETFERKIRDQLGRALSEGGFDPARDIEAITVNRWPHGYAYYHNPLFDPDWPEEERPWVIGRRRLGRITIANSDAAAIPLTQAAIDQAHRAVQEILDLKGAATAQA